MKNKWWIIAIVLAVFSLVRFVWMVGDPSGKYAAKDGTLDLTGWQADSGKVLSLRGEWIFYPGALLTPESGLPLDGAVPGVVSLKVPGGWDSVVSKDKKTAYGYGTYKLTIKLPPGDDKPYALRVQIVRTAHKLYIDGKLAGQRGVPGVDRISTDPEVEPYTAKWTPIGSTTEIVFAAANFDYGRLGGLFEDIRFGEAGAVDRETKLRSVGNLFFMGFYAVSGLFFLILYAYRRERKELLYFSSFFWLSLLFWATHGERLLFWLFPGIDYDWQTKLQTLSSLGLYGSLFLFACAMFPEYGRAGTQRTLLAILATSIAFVLATDASVFSRFEQLLMLLDAPMFFYAFVVLVSGSLKRGEGAVYTLIAAACLLMESVLQALNYWGYSPGVPVPPLERIVFVIAMALYIAHRFFTGMRQIEVLSNRLLVADRLKNDFLANTSQEIRLPLHGMINLAQLMIEEGEAGSRDEGRQERLALLVTTGRRLAYMLDDILDLSKLNDGGVELKLRAVDIRMAINGVLEAMRYMADGKISFANRTEPGVPHMFADERRLMQILFNLLHYAIKAGAKGVVSVQAEPDGGGRKTLVSVRAAREGLPEATETTDTSEVSLDISRKLIQLLGGELKIGSGGADGDFFISFALPAAPVSGASKGIEEWGRRNEIAATKIEDGFASPSSHGSAASTDAPQALVVDDDPVALRVMANLLEQEGLSVVVATDGLQGLKELESGGDWELVVLDVMLPGMSGYDLCRRIRMTRSFYDLPVLFLTSRNQPADLLVGFDAGANDYVTQPIDASEFRARAKTLLKMKRSIGERLHMEMAFIQAQIKPHFLYNTLNTIASLSETDPDKTRELLVGFGNYLRSSFDLRNLDKRVPFSKEWALVQSYLQIEQARFGDRMRVEVDLPEFAEFYLPPLSVQPLVENALRHGILPRFEGGSLTIRVSKEEGGYRVRVIDDGVGFPPGKAEAVLSGDARAGGIGLRNVHRRLINVYGAGLEIASEQGVGTEVGFAIPTIRTNEEEKG
ncbi:response regulator [Cohnella suwonensis]|uniref:histidine kinase n=1 Tax=Cohnella suwonensis TaxID=696072 RepID=A0ABW0LY02_9BACL